MTIEFQTLKVGQAFKFPGGGCIYLKTTHTSGFAIDAIFPAQYNFNPDDAVTLIKYEFRILRG